MDAVVLGVFLCVYLAMILGGIPGLALDRAGAALLGAIVLVAAQRVTPSQAWHAIDVSTMGLLFGLMLVSAQFRLGGFYTRFTRRLSDIDVSPDRLLALVIAAAGVLSAVLANDIICLAMAPVLAEGCAHRKLDPVPYLIALACAANVGSAATLIGNPQNMLIGQVLGLSFRTYLFQASVPAALGLAATWFVIRWCVRGQWHKTTKLPAIEAPPYNAWQTMKGTLILVVLMVAFLAGGWPRDVLALGAAGLLLMSRTMASRAMLQMVDWQLLVLFAGLFVVNHALGQSGMLAATMQSIQSHGVDPEQPAWLFAITVVLSNLVSNVPATMLLLPVAKHPMAGPILALASTLAGNLFIVGSIANIIVVDQAERLGIHITWRQHARIGIPVTVATLAIAAVWLLLLANVPWGWG
jgi:Na+/H+ antiporter NhaD/arsenite permease-like protein